MAENTSDSRAVTQLDANRAPAAPKRRGPWFGVWVTLSVLLLVPLALYLAVVLYVKLGWLDARVKSAIEAGLGPGSRIESVRIKDYATLHAEKLSVPPASGFMDPVLEAEAVRVDWSPWSLFFDQRIRRLKVEQPVMRISRNESGDWNFRLPRSDGSSAYRLEQVELLGGSLQVEWAQGHSVNLQDVQVTLSRPDPPLPEPLTLRAKTSTGARISGDVLLGPGSAKRISLGVDFDLARDLRPILKTMPECSGIARLRLDARADAADGPEGAYLAGPGAFDATLELERFRLLLAEGCALEAAQQKLSLSAGTKTDPAALPPLEDLRFRLDGVGELGGRLEARLNADGAKLRFGSGTARVNLNAVRGLFVPRLLGPDLQLDGDLTVDGLEAELPLGPGAAGYRLGGRFKVEGLRAGFPGLGPLPPIDLRAQVQCTAEGATVTGAMFKLGEVAQATLSARAAWGQTGAPNLYDLLHAGKLEHIQIDLARLFETEIGRRLAAQEFNLARPAPALDSLPLLAKGIVSARDLKVTASGEGQRAMLKLEGIAVRGLELLRWPLALPLPANGFGGEVTLNAQFEDRRLRSAAVTADLQGSVDQRLKARLGLALESGATGKLDVRRVTLADVLLPMDEFARLAGLKDGYGLQWRGNLRVKQGSWDLGSGAADCAVEFDHLGVELQLGKMKLLELRDVVGRARLEFKNRALRLAGKLDSAFLQYGKMHALSPTDFALVVRLDGGRLGSARLDLSWTDGGKVSVDLAVARQADGSALLSGQASTTLSGGLEFSYSAVLDQARGELNAIQCAAPAVDLTKLQAGLLQSWLPDGMKLGGVVREAKLELQKVPLAGLLGPLRDIRPLNGSLSGTLAGGRFEHQATASEAEDLDGAFRANFGFEAGDAVMLDLGARFSRYNLLVGGPVLQGLYGKVIYDLFSGQFYIPQLPERALLAKLLVRSSSRDGAAMVKLDKLALDLEGLARLEISGSMQAPAGGDFFYQGDGLMTQRLSLYDLGAALKELGSVNLRTRHPVLAEAKVSGSLGLEAKNQWSGEQGAILATLRLNKINLELGNERKLSVTNLDGPLPLTFYRGMWPADWPREQRGTITLTKAKLHPFEIGQQPLAVLAAPNAVALANDLRVTVPGGTMVVSKASMHDFFALEPAVRFDLEVPGISLDALARAEGWGLQGLGESILTGRLMNAQLIRTSGMLGSWTLSLDGELRAPFYQGLLRVGGFKARGLFGTSPVWGAWLKVDKMSMLQLTGQNKDLGRLKALADLSIDQFSSTGLGLNDIQTFVFDLQTQQRPSVEDEFDGRLALLLARPMVEDAMRKYGKSEQEIAAMKFALDRIGLRFTLNAGRLTGPMPLLPEGLIIDGRGAFSPDVSGTPNAVLPWTDAVERLREHIKLLKKLPDTP